MRQSYPVKHEAEEQYEQKVPISRETFSNNPDTLQTHLNN
jgi:hypothetical protein